MDDLKQERLQALQDIEDALKTAKGVVKLGLLAEARCLFEVLLEGRSWVDAVRALDAVREPAPKNAEKGYEGSVLAALVQQLGHDPRYTNILCRLQERAKFGLQKYGTYLHPNNGRDAEADLEAEVLDAVMYAAQLYVEKRNVQTRATLDKFLSLAVWCNMSASEPAAFDFSYKTPPCTEGQEDD